MKKRLLHLFTLLIITSLFINELYAAVTINADVTSGCTPLTVNFSTNVSNGGYYYWDFGDGAYDYTSTPTHIYTTPGIYSAYVSVEDSAYNYLGQTSILITVTGAGNTMNISEPQACPGTSINFSLGFQANSYLWNFGDGTSSTQASVAHSYDSSGIYNVSVIVGTTCGSDTINDQVTIMDVMPMAGSYLMDISKHKLCPQEPVSIVLTGYPNIGTIVNQSIDFGDGTKKDGNYFIYSYQNTGKYVVKSTFTNLCGNDTILVDTILVTSNQSFKSGSIPFNISQHTACLKTLFRFSSNGFIDYHWDFGDSTQSDQQYASHFYSAVGKYPVSLTVTDYCGNDSTIVDTVVVKQIMPFTNSIGIKKDVGEICPGGSVYFSPEYYSDNYNWDFGNGQTSDNYDETIIYDTAGTYIVSLTENNSCGSDSTVYDTIIVRPNIPIGQYFSYSIDISPKCPMESVNFMVSSTNLESVEWNFGDNNISREFIVNHIYYTADTFPVILTAQNWCGADTTLYDTVIITGSQYFTGSHSMNIDQKTVCVNSAINFSASYNSGEQVLWNFGDSTTSSSANTSHSYASPGKYPISLTYTNACGNDTVLYDSVDIKDNLPVSNIHLGQDYTICPGTNAEFNVSSADFNNVLWDFGDGSTISGSNVTHAYKDTGTYNVKYTVTNNCGMDSTLSTTISVTDNEKFASGLYNSISQQTYVDFNSFFNVNSISSKVTEYQWDFGDGTTTNSPYNNVTHIYTNPGLFNVSCTVFNGCGDHRTLKGNVLVENPAPLFTISTNTVQTCPNDPINFKLYGNYTNVKNCIWQFDDGFTTNLPEFTHAFSNAGIHKITVTVTDFLGNSQTLTNKVRIIANSPIDDIMLSMSKFNYCPDEVIDFGTMDAYDSVLWNFGDGSTSRAASPQYSYKNPGTYDDSVTAKNACGDQITNHFKIFITDSVNIPDFTISCPFRVCTGEIFGVSLNSDFASYHWDFGDGTTGNEKDVNHSYSTPGNYIVKLTVKNKCGNSKTESVQILVTDAKYNLPVSFYVPDEACPNTSITFYMKDTYKTYSWKFGDGTTSSEQNPSHSYSSAGSYLISLTVTDDCGNTGTKSYPITIVNTLPIDNLSLSMQPASACPGNPVVFSGIGNNSPAFTWNFGDGHTAQGDTVEHAFATTGNYNIKLSAQNACGDTASIDRTIYIGFNQSDISSLISYEYSAQACVNENAYIYFDVTDTFTYMVNFGDGTTTSTLTRDTVDGSLVDMAEHKYSSPGVYDVSFQVTNSCGQKGSGIVSILVGNNVNVNANLSFDNSKDYCTNTDITFAMIGGVSYKWNFGDGSAVVNSSGLISTVTHQYADTGKYSLSVIATNGCGNTATYTSTVNVTCIVNADTTSAINTSGSVPFSIYPNPAHDQLHIKTNNMQNIQYIEIHNLLGETLLRRNFENSNDVLDISAIKPGIYLIDVHTSGQKYICKFVKK